jgi:hypothetical protein
MQPKLLLATTAAAAAVLVAAPLASADAQLSNGGGQLFTFTCTNGDTFQAVSPAGATTAQSLDSTSNLLITSVKFTYYNLDGSLRFDAPPFPTNGNRYGIQDDLVTCTSAPLLLHLPTEGDVLQVWTVKGFLTPR